MATKDRRPPRLKNYQTDMSESELFSIIQTSLAQHKARRMSFDYNDEGQAIALTFQLAVASHILEFRMPARLENVARLVEESYRAIGRSISADKLEDQAYRTAWANIKDWVLAQMALVDAEMVKMQEVFLPYLLNPSTGQTYYEVVEERQFLLPAPKEERNASH